MLEELGRDLVRDPRLWDFRPPRCDSVCHGDNGNQLTLGSNCPHDSVCVLGKGSVFGKFTTHTLCLVCRLPWVSWRTYTDKKHSYYFVDTYDFFLVLTDLAAIAQ